MTGREGAQLDACRAEVVDIEQNIGTQIHRKDVDNPRSLRAGYGFRQIGDVSR